MSPDRPTTDNDTYPQFVYKRTAVTDHQQGRLMALGWQPGCDPAKESRLSPIPHDYAMVGDEDGSLADGGSYDVLECRRCGRRAYSPVAD